MPSRGSSPTAGGGAKTPAEAAKAADIVVSVVVNAAQTETILFGKDGVAETLAKDAVFVSSATMDPDVARRLAKQLEATGRHYLDAPISGGAQRAAQGELTILASGSAAAFAKARPALDAMAAKLYELGDAAGQGAAFKMINQLLAGVHIAAASEAIAFAAKQGLDIRKVYEVITASAGNSWMFENRMPHVLDGDYAPRSAVEIFVKDLGIIQDMARTAKFPVPVAAAALQMFLMTAASGMGRDDDASVARMYAASPARICRASRSRLSRNSRDSSETTRGQSMPRFAANLTMMFNEVPFLDRFEAAAKAGFTAVEFLFPYDHPAEEIGKRLRAQRPDAGAVQPAAGQLGRRREGFCGAAGSVRRSATEPSYRVALRAGDRRQAAASDGGHGQSQRSQRGGGVSQIGGVGGGVFRAPRPRRRARADQSAQRARLFPQRFDAVKFVTVISPITLETVIISDVVSCGDG